MALEQLQRSKIVLRRQRRSLRSLYGGGIRSSSGPVGTNGPLKVRLDLFGPIVQVAGAIVTRARQEHFSSCTKR